MEGIEYAELIDRIKASYTDLMVYIFLIYFATNLLSSFDEVPSYLRILVVIAIFGLYEPLSSSIFGATIGHYIVGIRIKKGK
ncbi:RDD family protein [Brumimicrobium aurantiacum]|uniref:RDD domain-containing protein n=1 Tax=Brumimicrobium aurantiacum TaxID=1737063 RepID=A0A3E1EW99_9FLAO|nr:RDD family protein [Brumimicrobium aurantiacum]RFC53829.1 hypothetical protein DXU93_11935 [Brumimicrobium aurantiacum]